jgi:uncharacterized membrane protein
MFSSVVSATWFLFEMFIFVAYIMVLFHIIVDLFRDTEVGGGVMVLAKAPLAEGTITQDEFQRLTAKALA